MLSSDGATLTDKTLTDRIPVLVYEIALEFRWITREYAEFDSFRWSEPSDYRNRAPIPDPAAALGEHKVQDAFKEQFLANLEGGIEYWRGLALKQVAQTPTPEPASSDPGGVLPSTEPAIKKVIGKAGRPPKQLTSDIRAEWTRMGSPDITAAILDRIGKILFPHELRGFEPGSTEHTRVRERVRQALRRSGSRSQQNDPIQHY